MDHRAKPPLICFYLSEGHTVSFLKVLGSFMLGIRSFIGAPSCKHYSIVQWLPACLDWLATVEGLEASIVQVPEATGKVGLKLHLD